MGFTHSRNPKVDDDVLLPGLSNESSSQFPVEIDGSSADPPAAGDAMVSKWSRWLPDQLILQNSDSDSDSNSDPNTQSQFGY